MTGSPGFSHTCPHCAKRSFTGRRAAKRAAKHAHPNDVLGAYRCPHGSGYWHYGHSWRHYNHKRQQEGPTA